jgi:hypothetical protein
MSEPLAEPREIGLGRLMFALLGGSLAWLAHFLSAYLLAEFGCIGGLAEIGFWGVTAGAWSIVGGTIVRVAVAVFATVFAQGGGQRLEEAAGADEGDGSGVELFLARTGVVLNLLFLFVILVESVPILYFLEDCGFGL